MYKRLIVPLDGSHLAEAVLPAAIFMAEHLQLEVILLHVIEKNAPRTIHGETHLNQTDQALNYLMNISAQFPEGLQVKTHVHTEQVSDVAASIADHAAELSSDLIVMCAHGSSGLTGWLVGSIAQQVIGLGRVPVLLISPEAEPVAFTCNRMLIPLDGNPEHEKSLSAAEEIAGRCGSHMHLLQVIPTLGTLQGEEAAAGLLMPGSTQHLLDMAEQDAQEHLLRHSNSLKASGFDNTFEVRRGDAVEQIAITASLLKADLIVLGTHGRSGQKAFWEGSVAPKIPGQTSIPLLLIPVRPD